MELYEETGYRAGRVEKLLDIYSHPGYVSHKVHLFVAHDLEWDPLNMEGGEEIVTNLVTRLVSRHRNSRRANHIASQAIRSSYDVMAFMG